MASVRKNRPEKSRVGRRQFLGLAATSGAGLLVLRSGALGADAPSNKLNIAFIGTWGRAAAHFGAVSSENVVALCDVDETHLEGAAKKWPDAKTYVDWRKCLDQKDINAVICSTTDHTHAFVSNWALNRDLHVYCEKPLANSVEEARVVRANWLKRRDKVATQVGTQRHEIDNFNRVAELIRDGAIGELSQAHAWGNRQIRRKGYPPAEGEPPKHLHYDLWIGPSPFHPYNPEYFRGGPGANCLSWNMYWDFGSGQIGDMGSHTMDLVWNAIDPTLPTTAQAESYPFGSQQAGNEKGKPAEPIPPHPEVTPVELHSQFDMPANAWRPAIKVHWWQGGMMPRSPRGYIDLNRIDHGAMFKGKNGFLICDFGSRILVPFGDGDDMTYYKPRAKEQLQPRVNGFQREWIEACKDPAKKKTHCDFDYSGTMIETMLLGLVAYRAGKKIAYDPEKGVVTDNDAANALLKRQYREGWTLNG